MRRSPIAARRRLPANSNRLRFDQSSPYYTRNWITLFNFTARWIVNVSFAHWRFETRFPGTAL